MAARHRGNRKARRPKKKKPQKKSHLARKRPKKLQPKKQKKRQARKAGSRPVLNISSSRIFAAKILRQMPKVRMETKVRGLMKVLLMDVYDCMLKVVEGLRRNQRSPALGPAEVQAALKEAITKELSKRSAEPAGSRAAAAA